MEFKEEYWPEALHTLRWEERKAFLRRWAPWLGLLLLLGGSGAGIWAFNPPEALAQRAAQPTLWADWTASFDPSNTVLYADHRSDSGSSVQAKPEMESFEASPSSTSSTSSTSSPQKLEVPQTTATQRIERPSPQPNAQRSPGDEHAPSDLTTAPANDFLSAQPNTLHTAVESTPTMPPTPAELRQRLLGGGQVGYPATVTYDGSPLASFKARALPTPRLSANVSSKKPLAPLPLAWKESGPYAFVGNSFVTGFGSRTQDVRANPEIGIGYEWVSPDPHWSLRGSLSYFQIGGITHAAHFDQQEAGFGLSTTRTTIQTETLHFAYLPVEVNWNITRRFTLIAGVGASYLVNSLSEVTISQLDYDADTELDRFEDWGYVGGYKSVNASLLTGMEWRPNARWTLGTQYQHGLTRITKASIYEPDNHDRNSRLRAYLRFAL